MDKINPQIGSYSFDYWMELAKRNPTEFEEQRVKEISKVITNAPPESRLRLNQLQFRIDAVRFRYRKNPQVCAQVLYDEMLKSLFSLRDNLNELMSESNSSSKTILKVIK